MPEREFSLPLLKGYKRPVMMLRGLPTLIDTGAIVPVFSPSTIPKFTKMLMKTAFHAEIVIENKSFVGFDGPVWGDVYSIPEFHIGELVYRPFEVFVPYKSKLTHPVILSATLFDGTIYTVDSVNYSFTVRLPDGFPESRQFHIRDLRGTLYPQIDSVLVMENLNLEDPETYFPLYSTPPGVTETFPNDHQREYDEWNQELSKKYGGFNPDDYVATQ